MTRLRLQVRDKVLCRHARIKQVSIVCGIDAVAIAIADEVIKLAGEKLREKNGLVVLVFFKRFGDVQTHHQRLLVIGSGCEHVVVLRRVLADGLGLLNAIGVGKQRRVQGLLLEEQLLKSFLAVQDEIARAICGKAGGIALIGVLVVVVQDVERAGGLDAVGVKTGKDGAVDDIGVSDEHERVHI